MKIGKTTSEAENFKKSKIIILYHGIINQIGQWW